MRVLFTTLAVKTHFFNMVPMAWALHTAGHEVCIASQPDLAETVARTGINSISVGEQLLSDGLDDDEAAGKLDAQAAWDFVRNLEFDFNETDPAKMTLDYLQGVFAVHGGLMFPQLQNNSVMDDLVRFAREWRPDLVIWEQHSFAGPVAARATGAAHARMLYGVDLIGQMRTRFLQLMGEQPEQVRDDPMADWLGCVLDRYGAGEFDEEMVVGQWSIDPSPPLMQLPLDFRYVPVRYVTYNGNARVPDWVNERPKRPRVCVSLGTSIRDMHGEEEISAPQVFDAVSDLDIEVIATLTAGQLEPGTRVPGNVRVVEFVPLQALLPSCAAIVHHGGAGTFGNALSHGVPQLIGPYDYDIDAKLFAQYVTGRGSGLTLDRTSVESLRSQLIRLLDEPSFKDAAESLRAQAAATPSPNDVVHTLTELTARYTLARA